MTSRQFQFHSALQDFQAARQRAAMQEILARVTGKSTRLLSYEEVAEKLNLQARTERGLRQIPLDAIVGSVGRYTDFTRSFLPRRGEDQQRWARVKAIFMDGSGPGLPPIEVYKVGQAYFVVDGNHRVSIARQEGMKSIEARVIEFKTDVPLTPEVQPDDLIIKAEYADFLDATHISEVRPNVDLSVTACCQYEKLMEQIQVSRYILQEERGGQVTLQQAVEDWYDNRYTPLVEAIRDRGLLPLFPGRTLTDLYLWISENRAALESEAGWEIQSNITATDLIAKKGARAEGGKSTSGAWRKARTVSRYTEHLFMDLLVPVSGEAGSWDALEQAVVIAQREGARLHGLHVVEPGTRPDEPQALEVRDRFNQRCRAADVDGKLMIETGEITNVICERAVMTDLVVLKVSHPPQGGLSTFRSPFRTIITKSARPLLGVPGAAGAFRRALLAYDGSLLAKEALFVATYLAEMWKTELVVFTALEGGKIKADTQDYVRRYLEVHEVQAGYAVADDDAMEHLIASVEEHQADLVLMGGYSGSVLREIVIGSSLDHMLRNSKVPLFICR